MKKLTSCLVLLLTLSTAPVATRSAHAVVMGGSAIVYAANGAAIPAAIGPMALDGLEILLGGGAGVGLAAWCGHDPCSILGVAGALAVIAGLTILDDDAQAVPQFSALGPEQASRLGLSSLEISTYQAEIPEINSVMQTITAELSARRAQGQAVSPTDAAGLWAEYSGSLSPESLQVMHAILSQKPALR